MQLKGAGIFFTDGKKVLLLRRKNGDHVGTWALPGGKADRNETPIETAKRECEEEIGKYQGTCIAQFKDNSFTVFIYKVKSPFKVTLNKEHDKAEWVDFGDLKNYHLHPRFKENLSNYLKKVKISHSFNEWLILRVSTYDTK